MPSSAELHLRNWSALQNAVCAGRLAHAYLLIGSPRGAGLQAAVRMLQLVFCVEIGRACGTCRGCRLVQRRAHVDVHWLEPESRSRRITIGTPLSPESDPGVRYGLIEPLSRSAVEGGWKAGVVLAADRLTLSAANALLKTLEEPPPATLLLLVSDAPHQIPATVLSRCQRIMLAEEPRADEPWRTRFLNLLAEIAVDDSLEGRLKAAARMTAFWAEAASAIERQTGGEEQQTSPNRAEIQEARARAAWLEVRAVLLAEWRAWERDALALALGAPSETLRHCDQAAVLAQVARRFGVHRIRERLRQLDVLERRLDLNLSESSAIWAFFRDTGPSD